MDIYEYINTPAYGAGIPEIWIAAAIQYVVFNNMYSVQQCIYRYRCECIYCI